jgi:hypothetical protein
MTHREEILWEETNEVQEWEERVVGEAWFSDDTLKVEM